MFVTSSTSRESVVETNSGHSYVLTDCTAQGIPPPTVRWYKDGQPLNFSTSESLGLSLSVDNTR